MRTVFVFLLCCLAGTAPLAGQKTVYVRTPDLPAKQIMNAANGPAQTIRLTVPGHGWSAGQYVVVDGVHGCFKANGTRLVHATAGSDTVDMRARDGSALTCEGTWIAGAMSMTQAGKGQRRAMAGLATAHTLLPPPNIWGLDGPQGPFSQAVANRPTTGYAPYDGMVQSVSASADKYAALEWSSDGAKKAAVAALLWHRAGRPQCRAEYVATRSGTPPSAGTQYCTDPNLSSQQKSDWRYFAWARYQVTRLTVLAGGAPGCDDSLSQCGMGSGANWIDYGITETRYDITAYSLIASDLTPSEQRPFADFFLNDLPRSDAQQACLPAMQPSPRGSTGGPGRASTVNGSDVVTFSDPSALSALAVGDSLFLRSNSNGSLLHSASGYNIEAIAPSSGLGAGQVRVSAAYKETGTNRIWFYARPFSVGQNTCGLLWVSKHHGYSPLSNPETFLPSGGSNSQPYHNLSLSRLQPYVHVGLALCQYDDRGCEEVERNIAHYVDQALPEIRSLWTGASTAGQGSYRGRVEGSVAELVRSLQGAFTPALNWDTGRVFKDNLYHTLYATLPNKRDAVMGWGETANRITSHRMFMHHFAFLGVRGGDAEARHAYDWTRRRWSLFTAREFASSEGPKSGPFAYVFLDPSVASQDYRDLPLQRLFYETDRPEIDQRLGVLFSRTGWEGEHTLAFFPAFAPFVDHIYQHLVSGYQIYHGSFLLADDKGVVGSCDTNPSVSCYSSHRQESNYIEFGDARSATETSISNLAAVGYYSWLSTPPPVNVQLRRWAGARPTGRSDNAYTYISLDYRKAYNTGLVPATRLNYEYLHLKAQGRDLVFRYTDVALSAPKSMRTFLQFPQNGQAGEGQTKTEAPNRIYTDTATAAKASMHTSVFLPQQANPAALPMTDLLIQPSGASLVIAKGATAERPASYRLNGKNCTFTEEATLTLGGSTAGSVYLSINDVCQIVVAHSGLSVGAVGQYLTQVQGQSSYLPGTDVLLAWPTSDGSKWAASGYVKGGFLRNSTGNARRYLVDLCGGNNTGSPASCGSTEELRVHEVHADAATTASPVLYRGNNDWAAVEITGTKPSVVGFARGGTCKTSWAATTEHDGNAAYVLAGLCAGNYAVQRSGQMAATITVEAGDESTYWEGGSGSYQVVRSGDAVAVITEELPIAILTQPYAAVLQALGGSGTYRWSLVGGTLPTGLTLQQDGTITGVASLAQATSFEVQVESLGTPSSSARRQLHLEAQPSATAELRLQLDWITSQAAQINYGRSGLDANQRCQVALATDADFQDVVEDTVDYGGTMYREYIFGSSVPLQPSTTYYARVTCGAETSTADFLTSVEEAQSSLMLQVSSSLMRLPGVASMRLEYGLTEALGESVDANCTGTCQARIPAMRHHPVYLRRVFFNAAGQEVARSRTRSILPR